MVFHREHSAIATVVTLFCAQGCGDPIDRANIEVSDDPDIDDDVEFRAPKPKPVCGDGVVDSGEKCDDGNGDNNDDCPNTCKLPRCGDGFVWNAQSGTEQCDDGNKKDDDGCSKLCELNAAIVLGGTNFVHVEAALDAMGVLFAVDDQMWVQPGSAPIIILADDGGEELAPDYNPHFAAGKHLLVIGGSSTSEYADWIAQFFTIPIDFGWHQSDDCTTDWSTGPGHPMTAMMPTTYEFLNQEITFHVVHFADVGQPMDVSILGDTCHNAPDDHMLVTRKFSGGGTLTYMALDLGAYTDANSQAQFVVPFLTGYLDWIDQGAP